MSKKRIVACLLICLFVTTCLNAGKIANIIYVDTDAVGNNDGSSWHNAFNFLQDALTTAKPGSVIRVAQGIYYPDQSTYPLPGGRQSTFMLLSGVTLEGGYAGQGNPKPWERDIKQYETILSGDLLHNDPPMAFDLPDADLMDNPNRQDNAYSVVSASGVEQNTILDGFTITGGNANMAKDKFPYASSRGGGLFAYGGTPTIRFCTFKGNAASNGGGGVYNYMNKALYETCLVQSNYSYQNGGGMANWNAETTILDSSFIKNRVHSQSEGGGLYNYDADPNVHKCIFTANDGGRQGGGMYNAYCDGLITQCQFFKNTAKSAGGAVHNATGSTLEFVDCDLIENQASMWAGGMMNYYCATTVTHCLFQGNTSNAGAGMYNRYSDPIIVNTLFNGNTSKEMGGAIGCHDTDTQITNCTFWANQAPKGRSLATSSSTGPSSKSRVQIHNSILWNPGQEIYNGDESDITVTYSNIYDVYPGQGNIDANPQFQDPLGPDHTPGTIDDNLHLASGSPCIDAADNKRVPTGVTTDLDDKARFIDDPYTPNTGYGQPPIVDMGSYEFNRQSGGSNCPIADAGQAQTVFARVNGQATVNLDGSDSFDPDGNPLKYFWHWTIDGEAYEATGPAPQVQMPVGKHEMVLVVSDGQYNSEPDQTIIEVLPHIESSTWLWPFEISKGSQEGYINAYITLEGIKKEAVDLERSLTLYPGTLKAVYLHESETNDGIPVTTLFAMFDKFALIEAVGKEGMVTLVVQGKLLSGQYFAGRDEVKIVP